MVRVARCAGPLLRRAGKRRPITLPIYGTEDGETDGQPRPLNTGIQTYESDLAADVDEIGDYAVTEDEIARFGDAHIGTVASRYQSRYVRRGR